ncbi:hypothetical protein HYU20_00520 [Candidatus Woesearchaeota archaeon]|nr:hypothetical protein [Candidatus Woesearchaeota archaeon]
MASGKRAGVKEEMVLALEIEKSKLNREKSLLLLDKALLVYFAFLVVGIIGFINKYLDARYLNVMIVMSFGVLAVGLVPYMLTMAGEERKLNALIAAYASGRSISGSIAISKRKNALKGNSRRKG